MATKRESRKQAQAQAQAQENVAQEQLVNHEFVLDSHEDTDTETAFTRRNSIDTETGEILENDNMLSSQEEKETQPEMQLTETQDNQDASTESQETRETAEEQKARIDAMSQEEAKKRLAQLLSDEKVTITPEMIDMLSGKDLSDALVKYASARKVTGKKDVPEFKLLPPPSELPVIHLSDLKTLLDTPIKNKEMGVRDIDENNVTSLKAGYARGDEIPPIQIVFSTIGPIIVFGRHRTKAMNDLIVEAHTDKDGNVNAQAVKQDRDNYPVPYRVFPELNPRKVVYAAFLDNIKNGLAPSVGNRSRFAIFAIQDAKENGEKLTQEEAAAMVGVSRVAVVRQIMRDKGTVGTGKKRAPMLPADYVGDTEDEKATMQAVKAEMEQEKKAADPLLDNSKRLFAAMRVIYQQGFSPEVLADYWMKQDFIKTVDDVGACDAINVALAAIDLDKIQAKFKAADTKK